MAQDHGAGRAEPAEVPEEYRAIFEAATDGLIIARMTVAGRGQKPGPVLRGRRGRRYESFG